MKTPRKPCAKAPSPPNRSNPVATVYITAESAGVQEAQFYRNIVLLRAGYKYKAVLFFWGQGLLHQGLCLRELRLRSRPWP